MANRDQTWGGQREQGQWRRDEPRRGRERDRRWEDRSFGEAGRFNSDEDRYGPGARGRYDEGYAGYGGQEYGVEGGPAHRREPERDRVPRSQQRESWRPEGAAPYGDLELNARNRGVEEYGPPHDYAYHPPHGHEFDSEYLHWREEQMRSHDRDYSEWRRAQERSYDEDYRQFREQRREHFGRTFQAWRSQKRAAGGAPNSGIAPEGGGSAGGGDASPEFGKSPAQVQAAAGGWDARGAAEEQVERTREESQKKER